MKPFEYANPTTLKDAVDLLSGDGGEAAILAGGTDLLGLMKDELETPSRVVDVKGIAELGANVLVIEFPHQGPKAMEAMMDRMMQQPPTPLPAVQRELEDLHRCG